MHLVSVYAGDAQVIKHDTLGDLHSKEDWRQDYVDKARRYYENVAKAHVPAPKTAVNIE